MVNRKHKIIHLVNELTINGGKDTDTLLKLSSCLETHQDINTFRQNNGLRILIDLVEGKNPSLEALKLLAICCTDNKSKLQILQWNAVPTICKHLKICTNKESLREVCRVVTSLCGNRLCRYSMHDDPEAVDCIVACLSEPWDGAPMSIYLKALRSLSRSKEHCEKMLGKGVLAGVCCLLKRSPSLDLARDVLTTINRFLKRWSPEARGQFVEAEALKSLAALVRRKDCTSAMAYQFVISKLLGKQDLLRYFGSSGIFKLFVASYENASCVDEKDKFLGMILSCCREANIRASALEDSAFLDKLLVHLKHPQCNHNLLLRTLICFKYNIEATNYLIRHHLISTCINLLSNSTSFNLAELTSRLLYAEVGSSITINTPVSPSTFKESYSTVPRCGHSRSNTPASSESENTRAEKNAEVDRIQENASNVRPSDTELCVSKRLVLTEASSEEEEELREEDFQDEDRHLLQLARVFEVDRKNQYMYSQVSSLFEGPEEEWEECKRKRRGKSKWCHKKRRLDSDFCLKSTLEELASPVQSRLQCEVEESTPNCILNLISHLVDHPATEKHLNCVDSICTLIYTIPVLHSNHKLATIFTYITQNPLYFKVLLSQMLLPMIDLVCIISPASPSLHNLSRAVSNNLAAVFHSNYAPAIIKELLSSEQSATQCTLSFCYLARDSSSRLKYFTQAPVMGRLVGCMYDHNHPLRLLSITSFFSLLSSVDVSCECDFEADEDLETCDRSYDVSFLLEDQCIQSVKSRLTECSEVFRAMFDGVYKEASSERVVVNDSSVEAFRAFNEGVLSGRFNSLLFEVESAETLLGVLRLSNRYLVKRLEDQIASLVCSNMPTYFDAVISSNSFLASRPLLVRCVLHVCQHVCNVDRYELITHFFKFISKEEFIDLSMKLIKSCCIHNV